MQKCTSIQPLRMRFEKQLSQLQPKKKANLDKVIKGLKV